MHIPGETLSGAVCPVTVGLTLGGLSGAVYLVARQRVSERGERPSALPFAAVSAFVFASQMLNFPISNGTSGHFLGGVLASAILGVPLGILSLSVVVTLQCLLFADGALSSLGANIFNMAIIGAGLGGALLTALTAKTRTAQPNLGSTLLAAWVSIVIAALAVSVELSTSSSLLVSTNEIYPIFVAMLGSHAIVGVAEGIVTFIAMKFIFSSHPQREAEPRVNCSLSLTQSTQILAASALAVLFLAPFASTSPDGLEYTLSKLSFSNSFSSLFDSLLMAPLPDYSFTAISNVALATGVAGLLGLCSVFGLSFALLATIDLQLRSTRRRLD